MNERGPRVHPPDPLAEIEEYVSGLDPDTIVAVSPSLTLLGISVASYEADARLPLDRLRDHELAAVGGLESVQRDFLTLQRAVARHRGHKLSEDAEAERTKLVRRTRDRWTRYCVKYNVDCPTTRIRVPRLRSRAPRRAASCSGRPRAQAARPSLKSGSSGDSDGPGEPEPAGALAASGLASKAVQR